MRIKRIIEIISEEPVYDIEVSTKDHTFLIDDVRVENCRLLSDTSKLDGFINSIGGTALSIGSCRVSTINLVRIAYETSYNKKKYLELLRKRVELNCKALYSMRHIIKRNIEKGLLPNYQDGAVELSKQYCTIGILGMYEVMDLFGLITTDEFGNKFYTDEGLEFAVEIMDTINDVKDHFEQYKIFELNGIKYKLPMFDSIQVKDLTTNKQDTVAFYDIERNPDRYEFDVKNIAKFIIV